MLIFQTYVSQKVSNMTIMDEIINPQNILWRYLDVFVLSNDHYYEETPLLAALHNNRAVRHIFKERYATNPIDRVNTVFLDPSVYPFDQVRQLIELVRSKYPDIVFVLCSTTDNINEFIAATGDRFKHYFQLDYTQVNSIPTPLVDKMIQACQIELDRNLRSAYQFDVALSFAGEERKYAEAIAAQLKTHGVSVFYDDSEKADLWGCDLYTYLHEMYSEKARYCILFASKSYADKRWPTHERQAAQERALREKGAPYILPIRCDNTKIPGLSDNIADLKIEEGIDTICDLFLAKMGVMKIELTSSN